MVIIRLDWIGSKDRWWKNKAIWKYKTYKNKWIKTTWNWIFRIIISNDAVIKIKGIIIKNITIKIIRDEKKSLINSKYIKKLIKIRTNLINKKY